MRLAPTSIRRPFIGWTIAFLTGIGAGLVTPLPVTPPIAAAALVGLAAVAWAAPAQRKILVLGMLVVAGWLRSELAVVSCQSHTLTHVLARVAETFTVRGHIVSDPEFIPAASVEGIKGTWRFLFRLDSIHRTRRPQAADGDVLCRWPVDGPGRRPRYGEQWEFGGVVRDRGDSSWFRIHRLRWTLSVHDDHATRISVGRGNPLIAACLRGREACARLLTRGIQAYPREAAVARALMLGYRSELPKNVERLFRFTGTLHVFAVSGLHVGVLVLLLTGLFRSLGIPSYRWVWLLIPLIGFYAVATGLKASTLRAAVMAITYGSAGLLLRRPDAPSAVALAAFLIVGWRPTELTSPGFILSFTVVAGLLAIYPMLHEPARRRLQPDPWQAGPEPRLRRWTRSGASYVASLLALSLACWLVSFPLIAFSFNIANPMAVISNLVVVPSSFLLVFTGCLSLLTGAWWGVLAEIFNHANRVFISLLLAAVGALADVPGSYRYIASPHWLAIAAWYALLFGWRWLPGPFRAACPIGLIGLAVCWLWILPIRSDLRITAFDARGAVTVHIDAAARTHLLVDPGPDAEPVLHYLRRSGVTTVDTLLLSRCDRAAAGAVPALFESLRIRRIEFTSHHGDEDLMHRIVRQADLQDAELRVLQPGDTLPLPGEAACSMVGVRPTSDGREACLFEITHGDFRVLLMTRSGRVLEYALSVDVARPEADVLILSDRSFSGSVYPGWLERVAPDVVVISPNRFPPVPYNRAELVGALQAKGVQVVSTEETGGVRFIHRPGRPYRWGILPPR
jgi:competence protein ComEC